MSNAVLVVIFLTLLAAVYLGSKALDFLRRYRCGKPLPVWQTALFLIAAGVFFMFWYGSEFISHVDRAVAALESLTGSANPPVQAAPEPADKAEADRQKHRADRAASDREIAINKQKAAEARAEKERQERLAAEQAAQDEIEHRRDAERLRAAAERDAEVQRKALAEARRALARAHDQREADAADEATPQRRRRAPPHHAPEPVVAEGDTDDTAAPAVSFRAENTLTNWSVLPIRPKPRPTSKPVLANIPRGAHGIVPLGEKRRVWESRCGGYVIWWEIEFVGIRGWINARYVEACIQADDGVTLSCRPTITASRDPCADTELRSPFPF